MWGLYHGPGSPWGVMSSRAVVQCRATESTFSPLISSPEPNHQEHCDPEQADFDPLVPVESAGGSVVVCGFVPSFDCCSHYALLSVLNARITDGAANPYMSFGAHEKGSCRVRGGRAIR